MIKYKGQVTLRQNHREVGVGSEVSVQNDEGDFDK